MGKPDVLKELQAARGGASVFDKMTGENLGGLYELAAAEIKRLRAALQHIAALEPCTDQYTGFVNTSAQDTASAALAED